MTKKFKYEAPKVMDLTGFSARGQDPLACINGVQPSISSPGGDFCNMGAMAGSAGGCGVGFQVIPGTPTEECTNGAGNTNGCTMGFGQGDSLCGTGSSVA